MKREKLQDAVGMVGDDLIDEAAKYKKKRIKLRWIPVVAVLLCISLVTCAVAFRPKDNKQILTEDTTQASTDKETVIIMKDTPATVDLEYCVSQAVYPERVQNYNLVSETSHDPNAYDNWFNDRNEFRADYDSLSPDISRFITTSTKAFLSDTEDNAIYSPVNVYMALALLCEASAGDSRKEILDALGSDSIESLRADANAIWKALYTDDGTAKTVLANSLWLRDDSEYKTDALDILSTYYYASSYEGEMGSEEYNNALRGWLNTQTDGLLSDQINGIELPEETVLALASTILFNGKWENEFNPERNTEGVFYGSNGEVTAEFMNRSDSGYADIGDSFTAYSKSFTESSKMTFILPEEGMTPQELIATDEFADYLSCGGRDSYMSEFTDKPCWERQKYALINFSMPKFDVSSQLDLTKDLDKLGITSITDEITADMSTITDTPAFLDTMIHGARVTVDEEGCTAAAFTLSLCGATSAPLDEIDFVLDRPFVFIIRGYDGLPLFIGTVNNIN